MAQIDVERARRIVPAFSRRRLRLAREEEGLTQSGLAKRVAELGGGLTGPSVSQLEAGRTKPSARTLAFLAAALDHPVEFLAGPPGELPESGDDAFFRRLTSTPARERRRASSLAMYAVLFARGAESYGIDLPKPGLTSFPLGPGSTVLDVTAAALDLREHLDIDDGPIDNVVRLAESLGVLVLRAEGHLDPRIDAFSVYDPARPVIVLGGDKRDWNRSRFDTAHELGHLVGHANDHDAFGQRWAEQQAHAFAAEFLMPEEQIKHELPRNFDVQEFLGLKERWGVSIQALVRRAHDVGPMPRPVYETAVRLMSAWGWRRPNGEPGISRPLERPRLLRDLADNLEQEGVLDALVADLGLPDRVLDHLVGRD